MLVWCSGSLLSLLQIVGNASLGCFLIMCLRQFLQCLQSDKKLSSNVFYKKRKKERKIKEEGALKSAYYHDWRWRMIFEVETVTFWCSLRWRQFDCLPTRRSRLSSVSPLSWIGVPDISSIGPFNIWHRYHIGKLRLFGFSGEYLGL